MVPRLDKQHPVSILKQTKNLKGVSMINSAEEIAMRKMLGNSAKAGSFERDSDVGLHGRRQSNTARNEASPGKS